MTEKTPAAKKAKKGRPSLYTLAFPSRPRYMHRRTYQRLRRQYEAAIEQYVGGYGVAG